MAIETEHSEEPSDEIAKIQDATHSLYGYAKAVNSPESISGIETQLDVLIEKLRAQILDHYRATLGKKLSLEDEEELRGLVEGLDALVRRNVTNEATGHNLTSFGITEQSDDPDLHQMDDGAEKKSAA